MNVGEVLVTFREHHEVLTIVATITMVTKLEGEGKNVQCVTLVWPCGFSDEATKINIPKLAPQHVNF